MYLNLPDKYWHRIEFKLTFWYAAIFIASWLVLFLAGFTLMEKSILSKDRQIIQGLTDNYLLVARTKGTDHLLQDLNQERLAHITGGRFVMVTLKTGQVLHLTLPYGWPDLDPNEIMDSISRDKGEWAYLFTDKYKDLNDPASRTDELEIRRRELPGGDILWLGHSAESREEYLENFRDIFFLVMVLVILVSVAMGAFMAWRSMAPVRALEKTVDRVSSGRMEARIPPDQGELTGLTNRFNKMLDRIEGLVKGMGEALDNVAHDLRTPLTRMGISIERNVLEDDPDKLREALFDCAEESHRISRMLTILMDISEAETGVMALEFNRIKVARLIDEVKEIFEYQAEEKEVVLESDCPSELFLKGDYGRLRQVLCNLVDNAVKYSSNQSLVRIEARETKDSLEIRVRDRGIGIPSKDLPKIFDRLYRGDLSRSAKGSGLGLSLVRAVVQAHNGSIEVDSRPGRGSVFILSFQKPSS